MAGSTLKFIVSDIWLVSISTVLIFYVRGRLFLKILIAMTMYCLLPIRIIALRPVPQRGTGGARGGIIVSKKGFYGTIFLDSLSHFIPKRDFYHVQIVRSNNGAGKFFLRIIDMVPGIRIA